MFHFMHLSLTEWRASVSFLLQFESLLMIRPSVNTVDQTRLRLFLVPLELSFFFFFFLGCPFVPSALIRSGDMLRCITI